MNQGFSRGSNWVHMGIALPGGVQENSRIFAILAMGMKVLASHHEMDPKLHILATQYKCISSQFITKDLRMFI